VKAIEKRERTWGKTDNRDHTEALDPMPVIAVPFGDDVSAVEIGGDSVAVLKTDMLVGKTDVPKGMSMWQAAEKPLL